MPFAHDPIPNLHNSVSHPAKRRALPHPLTFQALRFRLGFRITGCAALALC